MFFKIIEKLNYKKNFPYFVCTPLVYGIGAASEHISIASAYAKRTKKKLLLIKTRKLQKLLNYKVCNNALFDSLIINDHSVNKNFLYKTIDILVQVEFSLRRSLAISLKKLFKIDLGETFRFALIGSSDLYSEKKIENYNKILPLSIKESKVDLEKKEKDKCLNLLKHLGVKDNKIVCLHVRDEGYYKDGGRRSYRNSNINNYVSLIELLISKNYFVFRLGDKSAAKIKYSDKKFIDYPFTSIKSEIMDLFLIKQCEFYVGTPSGPMDTAYLFNKPVFMSNLYDLYPSFPRKKIDRGIFKKIVKKRTKEVLSLKDFANLNINYHQTEVQIDEVLFEENTNEELFEAMKEYLFLVENSKQSKSSDILFNDNQTKFNKFLNLRLEQIYNEEVLKDNCFQKNNWKRNEFLKIIKRFKSCEGTYSNSFLRNNF